MTSPTEKPTPPTPIMTEGTQGARKTKKADFQRDFLGCTVSQWQQQLWKLKSSRAMPHPHPQPLSLLNPPYDSPDADAAYPPR